MRTLLLLACVLAFSVHAEGLSPGTLKWSVATGGGSSERVFFFLEGARAPPRQVVERWTLEVSAPGAEGRTPLRWTVRAQGAKPTVSEFVAWEEAGVLVFRAADKPAEAARPLVQRELPPRPLSMERVPCTSQLLPGGEGLCAAVAGGPLSAPFFPLSIVVDSGSAGENALLSLAVMVMTAGIVIPGHHDNSVVATLDGPSPAPRLPPLLTKWRSGPRTVAALATLGADAKLDAETAGALLALAPSSSAALVEALTLRVAPEDRWPMLRLARQRRLSTPGLVAVVARLSSAGMLTAAPADDAAGRALESSALVGLEGPSRVGVEGLLAGRFASLRGLAARAGTPAFDAPAQKALETATLEPGEGSAIAALLSPATLRRAAPRFLERLPDEEGLVVITGLLDDASPPAAVALLERLPRWVDRQIAAGRGKALFAALPFDDDRTRVLQGTLNRAPEPARPALLVEALRLLAFDDGRMALLRKWRAVLPMLTLEQQQAVLGTFSGTSERLDVLKALVVGLEAPAAKALVLFVARTDGDNRVAALRVRPGLSLDAAEASGILSAATFDADRASVVPTLFELAPEEARPALLVEAVRRMSFDDGRMELLKGAPALVKRLDAGQRAAVLEAFVFEKAKAAALLGPGSQKQP